MDPGLIDLKGLSMGLSLCIFYLSTFVFFFLWDKLFLEASFFYTDSWIFGLHFLEIERTLLSNECLDYSVNRFGELSVCTHLLMSYLDWCYYFVLQEWSIAIILRNLRSISFFNLGRWTWESMTKGIVWGSLKRSIV